MGILIGIGIVLFVVGGFYFGLRYLDGDLSIVSEILLDHGNIADSTGSIIGRYYYVQTTYGSGRIKFKKTKLT